MTSTTRLTLALGSCVLLPVLASAQRAPSGPERPLSIAPGAAIQAAIARSVTGQQPLSRTHAYTLAELIDIAEQQDPQTRVSWERAKASAAQLGIARGALYPTLAAVASASRAQYSLFFGRFYREDVDMYPAALSLSYTLLDFGARAASIDVAKANLLDADFAFNDTHRRIVFDVSQAYYQLLDALGQQDAAQATVQDATTLEQSVDDRLAHGLATRPDALEAQAAAAQAQYELTSIEGQAQIAHGVLAAMLAVDPSIPFEVQTLSDAGPMPALNEPVQAVIDRALAHRPDLLSQGARLEAADAEIRHARSAYFPTISLSAEVGRAYNFGQQANEPAVRAYTNPYQIQLQLRWNLFDGEARRNAVLRAQADQRQAQAQLAGLVDQIQREVWTAYTDLRTAQRRLQAADALLQASNSSYEAAMEAYQDGVRTFVDVSTAQRDLARARSARISARNEMLTDAADLAFRAGNLAQANAPPDLP